MQLNRNFLRSNELPTTANITVTAAPTTTSSTTTRTSPETKVTTTTTTTTTKMINGTATLTTSRATTTSTSTTMTTTTMSSTTCVRVDLRVFDLPGFDFPPQKFLRETPQWEESGQTNLIRRSDPPVSAGTTKEINLTLKYFLSSSNTFLAPFCHTSLLYLCLPHRWRC